LADDKADKSTPELRRTFKADAVFIDGTLGTAGHTLAMLQSHPTCRVVAFDRDADSIEFASQRLREADVLHRVTIIQDDFRHAAIALQPFFENQKVASDGSSIRRIDGALVDAGMSLWQVSSPERGLSFRSEGEFADAPLDMRYNRAQELSAYDLVNRLSPTDLEDLLFKFADERWARRIALTIAEHRRSSLIHSTAQLVSLIEAAIPVGVRRQSRVHPATQTFAALRLAVNDEFRALEHGAWALSQVLAPAARLIFLTYSSHEDRTIKRTFRRLAGLPFASDDKGQVRKRNPTDFSPDRSGSRTTRPSLTFSLDLPTDSPPAVPPWIEDFETKWKMSIVTRKPLSPSAEEISANPLARSCKLRALEKLEL